jgi:hypothetical protein
MPRARDPTNPFDRFLAAYPERGEPHDVKLTGEAWRRAVAHGADPVELIAAAEAYRTARHGQPARLYLVGPRLWLQEQRWRDVGPVSAPSTASRPALVWVRLWIPGMNAWIPYRGKTPPLDRRGEWWFQSRFPPSHSLAAE